jgi:hypothetical protein
MKYFCHVQNIYEASRALKNTGKFADAKAARSI